MGRMQQRKGKQFENLVANLIGSTLGEWLGRNLEQYDEDAGRDLLTRLPFCIQCSHSKHPPVWKKLKEARDSARDGELSIAILRKDYHDIIAVMEVREWLALVSTALRAAELEAAWEQAVNFYPDLENLVRI